MILLFANFLRVIIGSANFMATDTEGGDNQLYVEDFFPDVEGERHVKLNFETHLCRHALALGCPEEVVARFKGKYNFSKTSAHVVASEPGTHKLKELEYFGILRLASIVRLMKLDLSDLQVAFEICSASIGNLDEEWITTFAFFAKGGTASSNIRFPPWQSLTRGIKSMFRHYTSKDPGRLFHLRSFLFLNPANLDATPHFLIIGSANFSAAAWGTVDFLKDRTPQVKIVNFECGVVIDGKDIVGLLERGSGWEDVIPYGGMRRRMARTRWG